MTARTNSSVLIALLLPTRAKDCPGNPHRAPSAYRRQKEMTTKHYWMKKRPYLGGLGCRASGPYRVEGAFSGEEQRTR